MTTLFQLVVTGPQKSGTGRGTFRSKKLFRTREAAEVELPAFAKRCCGDGLWDLEFVEESRIIELDLDDAGAPRLVVTDYWNEEFRHRPYTAQLHGSDNDLSVDIRGDVERAIADAGAVDGDEIVLVVSKTGRRPFGRRRVRWVEPHRYKCEDTEEAKDS